MGLHDELRRHVGEGAPVVRVERYEAVVLEPDIEGRCACGRGWPSRPGDRSVAEEGSPALVAGSGGSLMEQVVLVARMVESLAVRVVRSVLAMGARHPRFVLWAAVVWLVAVAVS